MKLPVFCVDGFNILDDDLLTLSWAQTLNVNQFPLAAVLIFLLQSADNNRLWSDQPRY